ncbi:prevent-host-death family protein [Modestobacter sp. DSM 44400]|uniref:type II toxin-antitoxin system Phd/YefM family antitoxin n=1 Tax=Modestobacter sp. DSM 44400 TaxID=1550230 RepID=UPI00089B0121|nr:type II toxin-antitoxin system prevent-host-death family antitoxin [Modestobacter sp. DSM 44400]SDX72021.1 prevent-host-death family protein [Modestobacter sp. DSM 44400]
MTRIGVRELRQNASAYLALVKAGETVEVTERGELVAVLVPPSPATTARERLIAEGRLVPASAPFRFPRRVQPPAGSPDSGTVLDELRAERL